MLFKVLEQLWRPRSSSQELVQQAMFARDSFKWKDAARLLRAALEREPGQPAILAELGIACAELGDADAAVQALRQSLAQRPDDALTRAYLAAVLRRCGERSAARAEFERAVADDPACGAARSGLILLLMDQCDWPAVDRQYNDVMAL